MDDVGKLTAYNPTTIAKFVVAFNNGYNITEACHYAGVHRDTYYEWLKQHPEFVVKVDEAKLMLNRKSKEVVSEAIQAGDINAARWHLERRDPDYRAKGEVDLNHGLQETRNKIKAFLEEPDAYHNPTDDGGAEPAGAAADATREAVAQPPSDIS